MLDDNEIALVSGAELSLWTGSRPPLAPDNAPATFDASITSLDTTPDGAAALDSMRRPTGE